MPSLSAPLPAPPRPASESRAVPRILKPQGQNRWGDPVLPRAQRYLPRNPKTPPSFWDNLSHVPLGRRALVEFNRRHGRTAYPKKLAAIPTGEVDIRRLKRVGLARFARHGGPLLDDLRGVRSAPVSPFAATLTTDPGVE